MDDAIKIVPKLNDERLIESELPPHFCHCFCGRILPAARQSNGRVTSQNVRHEKSHHYNPKQHWNGGRESAKEEQNHDWTVKERSTDVLATVRPRARCRAVNALVRSHGTFWVPFALP